MVNALLVADSVAHVREFAVAIQKHPTTTHAGVIYRDPIDGGFFLLHLGGPGRAARTIWDQSWGWVIPRNLRSEELFQLSVLCHYVVDVGEDIPYGFKYSEETKFLRDGTLVVADGHRGLTCATFVLALLSCYDIRLLDLDSWHTRPEDKFFIEWISGLYRDPGIADESACLRYRPEEVIAGCLCETRNVPFSTAAPLGLEVVAKMIRYLHRNGI